MFALIIRYFFLVFSCIYTHTRISNQPNNKLIQFIFSIATCILIPLFTPNWAYSLRVLLLFTWYLIFVLIYLRNKILTTITISILSFGLSYLSISISGYIICIFAIPFINSVILYKPIFIFLGGILQNILIYLLFRIKRLRNGMPFLVNNPIINWGVCLGSTLIFYHIYLRKITYQMLSIKIVTMLLIPLLAIALLIWWRHKITQSYVEKLRVDEVELLYKEISDKDLEIEKLHAHNEQLSGIIHKDNKLIPAMEMAVRNYLQTAALMKPEDARQTGAELLGKLERMAEERTGIIHTYQENFSYRQRSGLISIDAIVDYMENRASTLGIEYHYQFDKTLKEMLPAFITEDDAMHLLSDLIENAIIAATHSEKKNIHIHIGFVRSILFIDISDSGIPFTPETYEKFGNIQYTTHAEHGGSGIGLMDIAKLKKQYQFSLQIYEYPENETIYTKKIRILFDRKAHYLIQSYRAKELRSAILRNDLHVIPYSNKENP